VTLKYGLEITQEVSFKRFGAVSYSLFVVTGSILHQFRDKARYW